MSKEGREGYERKKRKNSFLLLTALTHIQDQLPFAVVGSREEIVVGGHKVRARQYPWGTVEGEWKEGGKEGREGGGREGGREEKEGREGGGREGREGREREGGERKRGARYTPFSGPTQFLLLAVGEDRRIWLVYVFSSPSSVENEAHCDFVKLREMLLR